MSYITDNFSKWTPVLSQYSNGRTAIQYMTEEDGFPEVAAIATINIPDEHIGKDEIIVKDYSENEGMYDMMLAAGHIGPEIRKVESGWITAPVCKLLIPLPV